MQKHRSLEKLTNFVMPILMVLTDIAVIAFAVGCGTLIYAYFGGNGLGVAAVAGAVSLLAVLSIILTAYFYRPKPYRTAVDEGHVKPIKLF